jgi:hypothetical protein
MKLANRGKEINTLHKGLREAFDGGADARVAIARFLELHGMLHSTRVAPEATWSYEDELLDDLEEDLFRYIPENRDHSVVWIVWHLSRIEDITMNLLVAEREQIFEEDGWQERIQSPIKHTCNGTGLDVAETLSAAVDVEALRQYRYAVGNATRQIVSVLTQEDFKHKPSAHQLQNILDEGAVLPVGIGVVDYWSRRNVAGLLLMPPTRHTMVHWNEAKDLLKPMP